MPRTECCWLSSDVRSYRQASCAIVAPATTEETALDHRRIR